VQENADELLAYNMRKLREAADMSQVELARQMSEHGHLWHQSTVGRIEAGRQPLRFAEAVALATVLKTSLDRLTWTTSEKSASHLLNSSISSADEAWNGIADGTAHLLGAQFHLASTVTSCEISNYYESDRIRDLVREARGLLDRTPEAAVAEGRRSHAKLQAAGADEGEKGDNREVNPKLSRPAVQVLDVGCHGAPATAELLGERVSLDPDAEVRRAAVRALAAGWHDDPACGGAQGGGAGAGCWLAR